MVAYCDEGPTRLPVQYLLVQLVMAFNSQPVENVHDKLAAQRDDTQCEIPANRSPRGLSEVFIRLDKGVHKHLVLATMLPQAQAEGQR